jgi:hypothetical protein
LVFEHTGYLNFKVIRVKSLESLRTVREVTTPSGQSLQINLEVQIMALDYEEPDHEVVESPPVFTTQTKWGASGPKLSANHMPRHRRQGTDEVKIVEIAKPGYYMEHPIARWWDDSWPVKKGDPGCPIIPIIIGPHKLKAICDLGTGMNVMPILVYDEVLQLGALTDPNIHVRLADQSTRKVKGILDDICLIVAGNYITADFVVLDTGHSPKAPIILGRPFLYTP